MLLRAGWWWLTFNRALDMAGQADKHQCDQDQDDQRKQREATPRRAPFIWVYRHSRHTHAANLPQSDTCRGLVSVAHALVHAGGEYWTKAERCPRFGSRGRPHPGHLDTTGRIPAGAAQLLPAERRMGRGNPGTVVYIAGRELALQDKAAGKREKRVFAGLAVGAPTGMWSGYDCD